MTLEALGAWIAGWTTGQQAMVGGAVALAMLLGLAVGLWRGRRALVRERAEHAEREAEADAALEAAREREQALRERLARTEAESGARERDLQRAEGLAAERERLQSRCVELSSRNEALEQRLADARQVHAELTAERDRLAEEGAGLRDRLGRLETERTERERAMAERERTLEAAEQRLSEQFENLANRIFEHKSEAFRRNTSDQLTHLLKPFREQMEGLHRDVREASKERHSLRDEISRIVTETHALTNALRGDSKRQGDWGELVLERLLEESGLRRGEEYDVQAQYTDDNGRRLRPDVVIHLPEQRDVVIDSKVSLTAYERYVNAETEEERTAHLRAHVESVRRHIDELAGKRYDHLPDIRTLDYTLMWVPLEPAYFAAMQADPALVERAMERRVIPVCATTLLAVLKTIERIWQYERQNRNVERIIRRASQLHDKFVGFVDALDEVGGHLQRAEQSYHTARSRLVDGRGNLVRQVEQLRRLGLAPRKRLDRDLVERADAGDEVDDGDPSDDTGRESASGGY
ncbi:DNA recombination protein RmuC [Arhodomonas sp. AD133]|uniref:DNA recombination protein RmuC n=1 Tax=Arhodomonas sp. AD133 TaxID=3415009 RepID=UPI003EBDCF92